MSSIAFKSAVAIAARRLCTSAARARPASVQGVVPKVSGYKSIQHLQSEWLASEQQKLIWQKRGAIDKLLYTSTIGCLTVGVGYAVYLILYMAFPHAPKE
jgi:hypothetical protein